MGILYRGRGDWMQTYSGKAFFPLDPQADEVDILDIAHGLGNLCRYNGHTHRFYSVAEHCVLLSHAVEPELALWALLHDAPEAYIGDMIRPLKQYIPDFRAVDDNIMAVIAGRFGLGSTEIPAAVKDADTRILLDERAALHAAPPRDWNIEGEPLGVTIYAWSPEQAKVHYLNRFDELTEGRFRP
ncbi:MAG: hypothetical protein K0S37_4792 [Microbacterium sp.]|nr:hypothetical protein [Microbacterium sp.]